MALLFKGLTFGIELEFTVAYIPKVRSDLSPEDPLETRKVEFGAVLKEDYDKAWEENPPIPYDEWDEYDSFTEEQIAQAKKNELSIIEHEAEAYSVLREVKKTLATAGFSMGDGDTRKWHLKEDRTVRGPTIETNYRYRSMELVSPAYFYTPDALLAVQDVLGLLTNTFCCNVNESTGMHVHVGSGENHYFEFSTLQKLICFFWAFSPQLSRIHPLQRQDENSASIRDTARYVHRRFFDHKQRPTPLQGVAKFMSFTTKDDILLPALKRWAPKGMAYNLIWQYEKGLEDNIFVSGTKQKFTIEFREHTGNLNAEAAVKWIETVVGIVDFCRQSSAKAFHDLMLVTKEETWEKLGDGDDDKREKKHGPILAEDKFTTIDLLGAIGLWGPALYYLKRKGGLYTHPKVHLGQAFEIQETDKWRYEGDFDKTLDEEGEEANKDRVLEFNKKATQFLRTHALRKLWDAMHAASKAKTLADPVDLGWTFDPGRSIWPVHDSGMNDLDADTDLPTATTAYGEGWPTDDLENHGEVEDSYETQNSKESGEHGDDSDDSSE